MSRRAPALLWLTSLISGACVEVATTQAPPAARVECAAPPPLVAEDKSPVFAAELPAGFFPPTGPWPVSPRVPVVALNTKEVRQRSIRNWDSKTLEKVVAQADNPPEIPAQLRGVLLAEPAVDTGVTAAPYAYFGPLGRRPVYFLSDGAGQNFMKGWMRQTLDGRSLALNVAMFAPGENKKLPLDKAIHLVDLEVNHGHGEKAADPTFVITEARVLDGTEVLPIDLEAAAKALDERAQASFSAAEQRAAADVKSAEKKLPPDVTRNTRPPAIDRRRSVTWDDARKELTFTYLETWGAAHAGPTKALESNCPPGAPCLPSYDVTTYSIGFQVGVQLRLSAAGKLLEETTFEPQVKTSRFTRRSHAF